MKKKSVLCAIPCFNESYNLPTLFADLESAGIFHIADVLFIDDHSTDETSSMIAKRGYNMIRHSENKGYGQAVQTGFSHALKENYSAYVIFPGDHQRRAKDLRHLILTHQQNNFDVISGSKFHIYSQLHGPIRRRIGNRIYSKIAQYGWNSPIEDVLSGFKIYSVASVLPFFQHLPRGYAFDICFSLYASRFGLRLMETPVDCRYDAHTSKMKSVLLVSMKMLFQLLIHLVKQPLLHPVSLKAARVSHQLSVIEERGKIVETPIVADDKASQIQQRRPANTSKNHKELSF
jgi:glycosyltransferase involved in cell wall biosynthesis